MAKRSVASATISFGLVAIPVKLYLTASAKNVSFNMISSEGNRVKMIFVDAVSNKEVDRATTRKGFEFAKGQFVIFTPEELKALGDDDGGSMEIKEFVPANSLNPLHVEKTYFLDTGKGGDKAYRLLASALKERDRLAVAQWTNRGRQHLIMIGVRDDVLVAHQMYYNDEIREFELDCATYTPHPAEFDMACKLMDALSSTEFEAGKYTNTYNEKVLTAVETKKGGQAYTTPNAPEQPNVGDLFAALQASLKA